MLQGATLSSLSTVLPAPGEAQPGAQPMVGRAGRREAAALPPLHPHGSPRSLWPPWRRGAAGLSLPAFCLKKWRKKGFSHSEC